jgi:hypothetical protein
MRRAVHPVRFARTVRGRKDFTLHSSYFLARIAAPRANDFVFTRPWGALAGLKVFIQTKKLRGQLILYTFPDYLDVSRRGPLSLWGSYGPPLRRATKTKGTRSEFCGCLFRTAANTLNQAKPCRRRWHSILKLGNCNPSGGESHLVMIAMQLGNCIAIMTKMQCQIFLYH